MKVILLFLALPITLAYAGQILPPDAVVLRMLNDVKNNKKQDIKIWVDLKSVAHNPRHSFSIDKIVNTFKNISHPELKTIIQRDEHALVRMLKPLKYDFELKTFCNEALRGTSKPACRFKIITIHP